MLTSAVSTHISTQKSTKIVDLENITNGNLEERMNNLMSDGKVINKMNHSKDSCLINLDVINTVTESGLNFSHGVIPNTANAAHFDLLSSSTNHSEPAANAPTSNFDIIAKTPKSLKAHS